MILSNSSATQENGRDALHRIAAHCQGFSIEHEFLLELCGGAYPGRSEELGRKAEQIDWNHLFAISPPDLYGYLGYKLREAGLDRHCPALLVKDARNACLATAAQWLRLRFELRRLATELAQHHVDFLLLKGAVLAFLAFPDSSLRSVSDIDVLVHAEALDQALECVYAAGFQCPERYAHRAHLMESALPGEEISLPLEKPGTRALMEVHTQMESAEPWFRVPIGQVWQGAQEANLDGLRVKIPDQHEFLFHLILHLARGHLFSLGLRPLLDIHLWVEFQGERMDWKWIASECVRRGYGDWAHLTLRIVCDSFRTQVPAHFFDEVPAPAAIDRLQRLAYEQIWADRRLDSLVPPRLVMTLAHRSKMGAISDLFRRLLPKRQERGMMVPRLNTAANDGVAAGFRRVVDELRLKVPQYVGAWRNGRLRWSSLQGAARLAKGRIEINEILVDPGKVDP
jgi:hypothetical protein